MSRLSTVFVVVLGVCCAACSSSGGGPTPARPATQTMGSADVGTVTITNATTADVSHFAFSVDAVWRVMPSVFDSVGIPITLLDQASHSIGNQGYKLRGRLGKVTLSRLLDCGNTQIGPNADTYDVFLSVVTTIQAEGAAGSKLSTLVDAKARPITYNQGYSNCASRGGIEIKIADLVKARLAK